MADALDTAGRVLSLARPGEDVEVYAVHRVATTIQAGGSGDIRSVGGAEIRGVGVRVVRAERMGYASTADLTPPGLTLALERARGNAAVAVADPADELPTAAAPGSEGASRATGGLGDAMTLPDKIDLVTGLARRVGGLDRRVTAVDTAEYREERTEITVVSTGGVHVQDFRGYVELWADALGQDRHGTASDMAYWCGDDVSGVDPEVLAAEAVDRTTRLLGRRVEVGGGLPVVLDPAVVADIIGAVGRGCTGGALASGRGPFGGLWEHLMAASCVGLVDDGTHRGSRAAGTIDDEGVARQRTDLIAEGRLVGALHSTATAAATGGGARSTGNARRATHKTPPRAAPTTLLLGATTSRADLMANLDDAIYIQQLSGANSGINAASGRVQVGAVGWRVRNGEAAGPIATVGLASTLAAILQAITAVADDAHAVQASPVQAPTVLCDGRLIQAR